MTLLTEALWFWFVASGVQLQYFMKTSDKNLILFNSLNVASLIFGENLNK